jgi:hypothetical protein
MSIEAWESEGGALAVEPRRVFDLGALFAEDWQLPPRMVFEDSTGKLTIGVAPLARPTGTLDDLLAGHYHEAEPTRRGPLMRFVDRCLGVLGL